ncbi:MAG: hypothetical protein H6738_24570 [Alphaproteobacteria bacterium]|nr:hypothetical protein [Alphaproteobacteria bacterium]MCB9699985.1 hypothetical protein [Alphaproteobacteria bacterium]
MSDDLPEDTDAATWERLVERTRAMGPAGRARRAGELNASVRAAALAGIRLRHPTADEREQRLYLAALLLGDDLVRRAFGWDPDVRGR